jgi:hypothetical protein
MLIDIALGVAGSTAKVGFAAIGQTSADFWNYASSPTPTAP